MSNDTNNSHEIFKASVPDIRPFANLLRGICFSNTNQRASMTINNSGFVVFVEESRVLLGAAWFGRDLFDEFVYSPESEQSGSDNEGEGASGSTVLSFPLNILLECLNIFGTATGSAAGGLAGTRQTWRRPGTGGDSDEEDGAEEQGQGKRQGGQRQRKGADNNNSRIDNFFPRADGKGTSMRLSYAGEGYPLVLLLAESADGPTTVCEIVTYDAEPQLDLPLDNHNIKIKCILKSSWLREALSEVDPSCEKITFVGNPEIQSSVRSRGATQPLLRIQADGLFGSTEMDYPNDKEVLETFECDSTIAFSYRFSHINKTLKALHSSSKTSLRIDSEGVLCLQFLSPSPSPRSGTQVDSIVDFRCLSIDETVS